MENWAREAGAMMDENARKEQSEKEGANVVLRRCNNVLWISAKDKQANGDSEMAG